MESKVGHYPFKITILTLLENNDRWAVCLGRDALEKVSRVRNG